MNRRKNEFSREETLEQERREREEREELERKRQREKDESTKSFHFKRVLKE